LECFWRPIGGVEGRRQWGGRGASPRQVLLTWLLHNQLCAKRAAGASGSHRKQTAASQSCACSAPPPTRNEPTVHKCEQLPNNDHWHGSQLSVTIEGNWSTYRSKIIKYLRQIAVITPYAQVTGGAPGPGWMKPRAFVICSRKCECRLASAAVPSRAPNIQAWSSTQCSNMGLHAGR
jgi:hypothetical protein